MSDLVLAGVSSASLGDLLKGYGVIATVGAEHPNARFWWNTDAHLVVGTGCSITKEHVINLVCERLPSWSVAIGEKFQKQRASKKKGISGGPSLLESIAGHDQLTEDLAEVALGVAVFASSGRARSHPLFPALGQDGSANYFKTLAAEASKLAKGKGKGKQKNSSDLERCLFSGDPGLTKVLGGTGGLYFPAGIKRYATGSSWVHEKDAAVSGWDFVLAIRGALLLRGAARSFRGSRRSYPSFPFVFRGSPVNVGGKMFVVDEVFLPTWSEDRPRTLAELQIQIRQFQARVGAGELASSAADFRRAVQGRGVAGGFDRFHRFVLERRKPGQRQPAVQAIARGTTVVGEGATELRVLLSRLDEIGWLDQLEQPNVPAKRRDEQLLIAAQRVHDAIHACADEPTADRYLSILDSLWQGNVLLLARTDASRVRPLPPLSARGWERVLEDLFRERAEARIARALASIGWDRAWPLACQILPVKYHGPWRTWRLPDQAPTDRVPWRGLQPDREFARLFWRRWLDAIGRNQRDALPFGATRTAPLGDVLAMLSGRLDAGRIQSYCSAFLTLDWSHKDGGALECGRAPLPTPTMYAVLRLWLDVGVRPPQDRGPSWDTSVAQCLLRGDPDAMRAATRLASGHLQVVGLPSREGERARRAGRSVARPQPACTREEARCMAMAVLVPIDAHDTERLARRLWIATGEESKSKEAAHA